MGDVVGDVVIGIVCVEVGVIVGGEVSDVVGVEVGVAVGDEVVVNIVGDKVGNIVMAVGE